jgi:hypothetical protein
LEICLVSSDAPLIEVNELANFRVAGDLQMTSQNGERRQPFCDTSLSGVQISWPLRADEDEPNDGNGL